MAFAPIVFFFFASIKSFLRKLDEDDFFKRKLIRLKPFFKKKTLSIEVFKKIKKKKENNFD